MPSLMFHLQPIMEAFTLLSSSRQIGGFGGVGPIPFSEMLYYTRWKNLNEDETMKWFRMLRAMDNAYLKIVNKPKDT